MVNVGLVTSTSLPRPETSPLTNWVLPAPSSPTSAMTAPFWTSAAKSRPNSPVCSALLEMNVAMGQVLIFDFRFSIQLANATQSKLREPLFPRLLKTLSLARRDREKELIVFAVGNRFCNVGPGIERQLLEVD